MYTYLLIINFNIYTPPISLQRSMWIFHSSKQCCKFSSCGELLHYACRFFFHSFLKSNSFWMIYERPRFITCYQSFQKVWIIFNSIQMVSIKNFKTIHNHLFYTLSQKGNPYLIVTNLICTYYFYCYGYTIYTNLDYLNILYINFLLYINTLL